MRMRKDSSNEKKKKNLFILYLHNYEILFVHPPFSSFNFCDNFSYANSSTTLETKKSSHYAFLSHFQCNPLGKTLLLFHEPFPTQKRRSSRCTHFSLSNLTTNLYGSKKLMSPNFLSSMADSTTYFPCTCSTNTKGSMKRLHSFCFRYEICMHANIVFKDIAITCSSHARRSIVHPKCHDTCHPLHISMVLMSSTWREKQFPQLSMVQFTIID